MMSAKCTTSILRKLRDVMKNSTYVSNTLQGYIIPSRDAHQSEYIAEHDRRIEYVSGFTGSAGTAIVTEQYAALWTDGRYHKQAEQELDCNWILMKDGLQETPTESEWLCNVLPVGSTVGVDPFLMCYDNWKTLSQELKAEGRCLMPVKTNLVDYIWESKPIPDVKIIECLPVEITGHTFQEKIAEVRVKMSKNKATILIITALDEIAWLFNLRGSDIQYNPVFYSYAVVTFRSVHFFIDERKLTPVILRHLQEECLNLKIHSYENIFVTLQILFNEISEGKIWINGLSSYAVVSTVPTERLLLKCSPIAVLKAIKNSQEISSMRHAHVKDAAALCEFFCWLTQEVSEGNLTELDAVEKLEGYRKLQKDYVGPSFETISAAGPNGAIIHYNPCPDTNRKISTEDIYLCDSGGQYRDGTTDVTRTWHFGVPTSYEKECYTLVLKGHIALASSTFPMFLKGQLLDSFARKALWDSGLDYAHGTSHGVGVYLNVHEGPMGISHRPHPDDPGLQPGMILSIEPGYYEENQFGIRIENLALIKRKDTKHKCQNREFLGFESLTLVPIQTKLVEPSMLTDQEIKWLNDYHIICADIVGRFLQEQGKTEALQWLLKETLPLG